MKVYAAKKTAALLWALMLVLFCVPACAKEYTLGDEGNGYFVCEEFSGELTRGARAVFGGLLREGDETLCGAMFTEHYKSEPGRSGRCAAMLAVRRAGKILLMGANRNGDESWMTGVETDSFLPPDAEFTITCEPMGEEYVTYVHLALTVDDQVFLLRTQASGALFLYEYRRRDSGGSELIIDCYGGSFYCREKKNGEETTIHAPEGGLPNRLCTWTLETFPDTPEKIDAWLAEHPMDEPDDVGYIWGVNLREEPTGKSRSWGKYTAKVKILGQQPGLEVPWFHVQIGNLDGWVSGLYLRTQRAVRADEWADSVNTVLRVCRAKADTTLLRRPDGDGVKAVPAGTLLHVIEENDGWLHVILPRGEISWRTDWNGTYGFIEKKNALVGISAADAMGK